jgi:hypothetical protein
MVALVLLCLVPALAVAAAQTGTVNFRGVPLGATDAEFKRANPGFDCTTPGARFADLGDRICELPRVEASRQVRTVMR